MGTGTDYLDHLANDTRAEEEYMYTSNRRWQHDYDDWDDWNRWDGDDDDYQNTCPDDAPPPVFMIDPQVYEFGGFKPVSTKKPAQPSKKQRQAQSPVNHQANTNYSLDLDPRPVTVSGPDFQSQPVAPTPDSWQDDPDNQPLMSACSDLLKTDKNAFIFGSAGTGKSTLLRHILHEMSDIFAIVVLAPTGVAAINVGGETIHHFLHLKPAADEQDTKRAANKARMERPEIYTRVDWIIIDEISMVRADLFDSLNLFLQIVRGNRQPFGGVRLICFGDLFQLAPIVRQQEAAAFSEYYQTPYFYGSHAFDQLMIQQQDDVIFIELSKIYRQSDPDFINLLQKIRRRELSAGDLEQLNRQVISHDQLKNLSHQCVTLTATKAAAKVINDRHMNKLQGQINRYQGTIEGNFNYNSMPTDKVLVLRPGARVMLLNNDPEGRWVNGTMGTVVSLQAQEVSVRLDDGPQVSVREVSWEESTSRYDRLNHRIVREVVGKFTQIPLKLAWAITIHKSQGQTYDEVAIDLGERAFAEGQTYVALSRARTLKGIHLVRPVTLDDIYCCQDVVNFERKFSTTPDGRRRFKGLTGTKVSKSGVQETIL
ncbi:AAA family ATPase [bacterium]|nr:AAA family ATPase [bacterium]